jgi:hypothetical protein
MSILVRVQKRIIKIIYNLGPNFKFLGHRQNNKIYKLKRGPQILINSYSVLQIK